MGRLKRLRWIVGAFALAALASVLWLATRPPPPVEARACRSTSDLSATSPVRAAAKMALKDGIITREEDRHLLLLAEHLGIPASRAYETRWDGDTSVIEYSGPLPFVKSKCDASV